MISPCCRFSGTTPNIKGDIVAVQTILKAFNAGEFFFAKTKQDELDLWAARKEVLWTLTSIKPEGHSLWSTDVAVPISRLAELISEPHAKPPSSLKIQELTVVKIFQGRMQASLASSAALLATLETVTSTR